MNLTVYVFGKLTIQIPIKPSIFKIRIWFRVLWGRPQVFDWYYIRNPCRWYQNFYEQNLLPIHAFVDSDNRIVALHCYSPFDIYSSEKHFRGCFDEEWISISETRGLGRLLAKKLLNKVDVYCGYGCNELSKAAFKKLGVTFVATTPRVVSILDRRAIIKMISEAEGELPLFDVPNDTLSHNVSFKILSFDEVSEHSIENNLTKDDLPCTRIFSG